MSLTDVADAEGVATSGAGAAGSDAMETGFGADRDTLAVTDLTGACVQPTNPRMSKENDARSRRVFTGAA